MRRQVLLCLGWTVLVLAVIVSGVNAGGHAGMVGLSASVQESHMDIMVPIWTSDQIVIRPSLSVANLEGGNTDLGLGAAIRYNFRTDEAVPYAGVMGGLYTVKHPAIDEQLFDFYFGPLLGGEYFFSEHFSAGVETYVLGTKSDRYSGRFGNPDGWTVNTGTSAIISFYF